MSNLTLDLAEAFFILVHLFFSPFMNWMSSLLEKSICTVLTLFFLKHLPTNRKLSSPCKWMNSCWCLYCTKVTIFITIKDMCCMLYILKSENKPFWHTSVFLSSKKKNLQINCHYCETYLQDVCLKASLTHFLEKKRKENKKPLSTPFRINWPISADWGLKETAKNRAYQRGADERGWNNVR